MTRPDPGAGGNDSAKGFAKLEDTWNMFRTWAYGMPQVRWSQVNDHISRIKAARR